MLSIRFIPLAMAFLAVLSVAQDQQPHKFASPADRFKTLVYFAGTDGAEPTASLIQGTDGNYYGTTEFGGAYGGGAVFKVTPGGALTTLYSFCSLPKCADGGDLWAPLIQGTDGNFYGTAENGGVNGQGCYGSCGTVFRITPAGKLTTLHSFHGDDGANPYAGLVQATDGNLYGATSSGGANSCGIVFKITPGGKLTLLYNFGSKAYWTDGCGPLAGLMQATDGDFYGTTADGGANYLGCNGYGCGTVFKITAGGKLKTLYGFCSRTNCADGATPYAGLLQASNGDFYGTTYQGGGSLSCRSGCGTVFKITAGGRLTKLHTFQNGAGEEWPFAGLIQATDGNLYGTTSYTVFKIAPSGRLTTLHHFNGNNGGNLAGGLVQATNGKFYGTTSDGGSRNCDMGCGTIFSLSVGLGPFVETQPTSSKVGAAVKILGTDLTGATSITFNGTASKFEIVSKSLIKATVPTGATTGTVEVTIPRGTLNSNVVFRVTK